MLNVLLDEGDKIRTQNTPERQLDDRGWGANGSCRINVSIVVVRMGSGSIMYSGGPCYEWHQVLFPATRELDFRSQMRQVYSQNTTMFSISYRWFTSCQQLHVSVSISAIIRL